MVVFFSRCVHVRRPLICIFETVRLYSFDLSVLVSTKNVLDRLTAIEPSYFQTYLADCTLSASLVRHNFGICSDISPLRIATLRPWHWRLSCLSHRCNSFVHWGVLRHISYRLALKSVWKVFDHEMGCPVLSARPVSLMHVQPRAWLCAASSWRRLVLLHFWIHNIIMFLIEKPCP